MTGTAAGTPISFGQWVSGKTPTHPPAAFVSFTGLDTTQYHMRLTTVPSTAVTTIGSGCTGSGTTAPRLVLSTLPKVGTTPRLEIAGATASVSAAFALGVGPTLPTPQPLLGCSVWLSNAVLTVVVTTSTAGDVPLPLPIPNDPTLAGLQMQAQGVIATLPGPGFTNALEFRLQ